MAEALEWEAAMEAAAAFRDALDFSDVAAEIMEIATSGAPEGAGIGFRSDIGSGEVATGAVAAASAAGGLALPGVVSSLANEHDMSLVTPDRPVRPVSTGISPLNKMPKVTKSRKSKSSRYHPYGRRRNPNTRYSMYRSKGERQAVKVYQSALAGSGTGGKAVKKVVTRLVKLSPTAQEGGGALTDVISNQNSQTTPDGFFSFGYAFKLSQFTSYADFTAMYQWYKILSVKLHFIPLQNTYPAQAVSNANDTFTGAGVAISQAPILCVCEDKTSDATFATIDVAMAHHSAKVHTFNDANELVVYVAPKPTGLLGVAGSEVAFETQTPQWITTSDTTVPHYGLRCYMNGMNDHSSLQVLVEMKVAFKGLKH